MLSNNVRIMTFTLLQEHGGERLGCAAYVGDVT